MTALPQHHLQQQLVPTVETAATATATTNETTTTTAKKTRLSKLPRLSEVLHLGNQLGSGGGPTITTTTIRTPTKRIEAPTLQMIRNRRNQAIRVAAEDKYRERRFREGLDAHDAALDAHELAGLPRFSAEEIYCGEKLGNGSFGAVYEIMRIRIATEHDENFNTSNGNDHDEQDEHRAAAKSFMAQHCLRETSDHERTATSRLSFNFGFLPQEDYADAVRPSKDARYAIKKLRARIVKGDKELFAQAMIDMATETRLLASIPHHPNIIKLRGLASTQGSSKYENNHNGSAFPSCCFHENYFLVLDRLYGTLEDRLAHWKKHEPKRLKLLWGASSQRQIRKDHLEERLLACHDLASGLAHLHRHNIIHRDIKPPNIGFNIRGDLTLFDFGLSRELPATGSGSENQLFRLTGFCGSPRYMAPEVGLHKVYNAKCDVYSFGLLAWQILTLQKPYEGCDMDDLEQMIWPGTKGVIGPGDWTQDIRKHGGRAANALKTSAAVKDQSFSESFIVATKSKKQTTNNTNNTKKAGKRSLFETFKGKSTSNLGCGKSDDHATATTATSKRSLFGSFKSGHKSTGNLASSPDPISGISDGLDELIDRAFGRNIASRPTMKELEDYLRRECNIETSAYDLGYERSVVASASAATTPAKSVDRRLLLRKEVSRRRSTHVFQPPPPQQQPQPQPPPAAPSRKNRLQRSTSKRKSKQRNRISPKAAPQRTSSKRVSQSQRHAQRHSQRRASTLEDNTHHGSAMAGQYSESLTSGSFDLLDPVQ